MSLRPSLLEKLPPFGLGCAQLGDLFRPLTDSEAQSIVDTAWAEGVRYFDTAPHYGLGLSERRLGAALASRPREEYIVSTKVGRLLRPIDEEHVERVWDFTREGVVRSLDDSLQRLGLDHVDIVLLHDPHESGQLERALTDGVDALAQLREQGVVGAIGVGAGDVGVLERFVAETDIDAVMLPGRYTLLDQTAKPELLPLCEERQVGVLNAGVFNTGILARSDVPDSGVFEYGDAPVAIIERAREISAVCASFGVELPAAAIQFSFTAPAVRGVVIGADTPDQVSGAARRLGVRVPETLWRALADRGLVAR
jgi:D-threo-aldose 1-dehydrogenase